MHNNNLLLNLGALVVLMYLCSRYMHNNNLLLNLEAHSHSKKCMLLNLGAHAPYNNCSIILHVGNCAVAALKEKRDVVVIKKDLMQVRADLMEKLTCSVNLD